MSKNIKNKNTLKNKTIKNKTIKNKTIKNKTIKNKTIAVDFDGTLVTDKYPEIGEPNVKLINKLRKLSKDNTLILWTCRNGDKLKEAVEFCRLCDLNFDYVNENTEANLKKYNYEDCRKICADIYIDDRAVTTI